MDQQKIFFSYAREDASEFALKLANVLSNAGADVWIDQLHIHGGKNFHDEIAAALDAASTLVYVISEKSVHSKYVKDEVFYALDEGKTVIPVICYETKLHFRLRSLQHISFLNGFEKGVEALRKALNLPIKKVKTSPKQRNLPRKVSPNKKADTVVVGTEKAHVAYEEGMKLLRSGQYTEAMASFTSALQHNPKNAEFLYRRGMAKEGLSKYEEAIEDFSNAIELRNSFAKAYNRRGAMLYALKEYDKAIPDFDKAIQLYPQSAECYNNRGMALAMKCYLSDAKDDFTQAIRLKEDFAAAYNNRGVVRAEYGDYKGALEDYALSLKYEPQNHLTLYNRGWAKYFFKDKKGGEKDMENSIKRLHKFKGLQSGTLPKAPPLFKNVKVKP